MARAFFSWRQPGGALSVAAHLTLLVASVYAFSTSKPFEPAAEAVPVDVVSESQFNEIAKGQSDAKKQPEPKPIADRVAEVKEERDPGLAKRNAPTPPPPPQRAEAKPEPEKLEPQKVEPPKPEPQVAAVIPPVRPPLRAAPPLAAPPLPAPPEPDEEVEEAIRQKPEPLKPDALDKLLKEQQQADERRKAEELKKAEEMKKAEAERKAREAREKARKEREAKEAAEAERLNDAIRQRLLTSREPPASTGSAAAAVNRQASLGAANATGEKLSPSDKALLIGILTEQMSRCIAYNGSAPRTGPQITFTLGRDGAIVSQVQLVNRSAEPSFVPFAEASMRALRNCQPYRIPARFLASYDDWKNVRLNMITDALQ